MWLIVLGRVAWLSRFGFEEEFVGTASRMLGRMSLNLLAYSALSASIACLKKCGCQCLRAVLCAKYSDAAFVITEGKDE